MNAKQFTQKSIELMQGCQSLIEEYGLDPVFYIKSSHLNVRDTDTGFSEKLMKYDIEVDLYYGDLRGFTKHLASIVYISGRWGVGSDKWKPEVYEDSLEECLLKVREIYTKRVNF